MAVEGDGRLLICASDQSRRLLFLQLVACRRITDHIWTMLDRRKCAGLRIRRVCIVCRFVRVDYGLFSAGVSTAGTANGGAVSP